MDLPFLTLSPLSEEKLVKLRVYACSSSLLADLPGNNERRKKDRIRNGQRTRSGDPEPGPDMHMKES